jgi:hypothetical protein
MMDESNGSMMALIKKVSKISNHEEIVVTRQEYDDLMQELHQSDQFLKNKYLVSTSIPRIYSLYGVKISISQG